MRHESTPAPRAGQVRIQMLRLPEMRALLSALSPEEHAAIDAADEAAEAAEVSAEPRQRADDADDIDWIPIRLHNSRDCHFLGSVTLLTVDGTRQATVPVELWPQGHSAARDKFVVPWRYDDDPAIIVIRDHAGLPIGELCYDGPLGLDNIPPGDLPGEVVGVYPFDDVGEDWFEIGDDEANADALLADAPPATSAPANIEAHPYVWKNPKLIPPRRHLYGSRLFRRFISATVAQSGVGKSSIELVDAVAMATGRDLLGHKPCGPLRVWYWNGEDPQEEIDRRIAAICKQYAIGEYDLGGRLFIDTGRETKIIIAQGGRDGLVIAEPVKAALIDTIGKHHIDVLIIDPFVSCHLISENDNNLVNAVLQVWRDIADVTDCAIEVVHHTRKGAVGQDEFSVDDARGASALIAAVRSARVLNVMSKQEAERAGIEDSRELYIRADNGKRNMTPPASLATWCRLASVDLGNGSQTYPSDHVGVATAWTWPSAFDEVTVADLRAVQKRIAAGQFRANAQAEQWAGKVVAEVLGLDLDEPSARDRVKALLRVWIENGMLKTARGLDANRHPREFIEVAEWASD